MFGDFAFFADYTDLSGNSLHPDQVRHYIRPDLDPDCSQSLSADDKKTPLVEEAETFLNHYYINPCPATISCPENVVCFLRLLHIFKWTSD